MRMVQRDPIQASCLTQPMVRLRPLALRLCVMKVVVRNVARSVARTQLMSASILNCRVPTYLSAKSVAGRVLTCDKTGIKLQSWMLALHELRDALALKVPDRSPP
jgi:hypothetical protein